MSVEAVSGACREGPERWRGMIAERPGNAKRARAAAGRAPRYKGHKKGSPSGPFFDYGGVDGTRTRDPRRDRPVF